MAAAPPELAEWVGGLDTLPEGGCTLPPGGPLGAVGLARRIAARPPPPGKEGRVVLALCHSAAGLGPWRAAGVPGHYERQIGYRNAFLAGYRRLADLGAAEFGGDDDPLYCMTYGQLAKLLRQLHANLVARGARGERVHGARLCLATHLLMLDPGSPSTESALALGLLRALREAGARLPRVLHLSQGPALALGGRGLPCFWGPGAPRLSLSAPEALREGECPPEEVEELAQLMGAELRGLAGLAPGAGRGAELLGLGWGTVYAVLPDARAAEALRRGAWEALQAAGWELNPPAGGGRQGGLRLRILFHSQLAPGCMPEPEHLLILPALREPGRYRRMGPARLAGVLGLLPRAANSAGAPLAVSVAHQGSPVRGTQELRPLLLRNPTDPHAAAAQHLAALPPQDLAQVACQLAEASVQPAPLLGAAAVEAAAAAGLLAVGRGAGEGPTVLRLTAAGLFAARANLPPPVAGMIHAWQRTPYGPYPAYCAAALLERALAGRSPLLVADAQTIARIAADAGYTDPFVHQMDLLSQYTEAHGLRVATEAQLAEFAARFGADPQALSAVVARVIALRNAGISTDQRYGPFDPRAVTAALAEHGIFPVGTHKTTNAESTAYCIGSAPLQHTLPKAAPYPLAPSVLVLHSERKEHVAAWERHSIPVATLVLYAAL